MFEQTYRPSRPQIRPRVRSHVNRYMASVAFLSTAGFKDQDSLSARLVQARFSGMFRYSCRCFIDFSNDATHAAAGSQAPDAARRGNPPEYGSEHDRNHLLYAAILFSESFGHETGGQASVSPLAFWEENCEIPNLHRTPVPNEMSLQDSGVYGTQDVFGNPTDASAIGPLFGYGSLRQLRDVVHGGVVAASFPEDFTLRADVRGLDADRKLRASRKAIALYQNAVCDPIQKLTIEEAIGDPPFTDLPPVRDASDYDATTWDLSVDSFDRGQSDFDRRMPVGCGLGQSCDLQAQRSYRESSLYQWVYVTSSDDPGVLPGWHRLTHIPLFPADGCDAMPNQPCGVIHTLQYHVDDVQRARTKDGQEALVKDLGERLGRLGFRINPDPITGFKADSYALTALDEGYYGSSVDARQYPRVYPPEGAAASSLPARSSLSGRRLAAAAMPLLGEGECCCKDNWRESLFGTKCAPARLHTRCPCGYVGDSACGGGVFVTSKIYKYKCKRNCPDTSTLLGRDEAAEATFLARLHAALADDGLTSGAAGSTLTLNDVRTELSRANDFAVRIHNPNAVLAQPDDWRTGAMVLRDERCSDALSQIPMAELPDGIRGIGGCQQLSATSRGPYADSATPGCSTAPLELDDAQRDQPYTAFLDRLSTPAPPPRPPPSKPPCALWHCIEPWPLRNTTFSTRTHTEHTQFTRSAHAHSRRASIGGRGHAGRVGFQWRDQPFAFRFGKVLALGVGPDGAQPRQVGSSFCHSSFIVFVLSLHLALLLFGLALQFGLKPSVACGTTFGRTLCCKLWIFKSLAFTLGTHAL